MRKLFTGFLILGFSILVIAALFTTCSPDTKIEAPTYTVVYDANGGYGDAMPTSSFTAGVADYLRDCKYDPAPPCTTFVSWNTKADGSGINYSTDEEIQFEQDSTLYAIWGYRVTFNSMSGSPVRSQAVPKGGLAVSPANPTRTYFDFAGWYKDSEDILWDFDANYVDGDITLYSKWDQNNQSGDITYFTINFSGNSSTGGLAPNQYTEVSGEIIKLPDSNGLVRTGYSFGGWNTEASGAGINYSIDSDYIVSGNITLYAKWNPNTYSVNFDGNNATSGAAPQTMTGAFNSGITLPGESGLKKDGFLFGGWNTESSGTGTNYDAGASYLINNASNITLFAKWDIACTVTFSANNGSGQAPDSVTVKIGSVITLPSGDALYKEDYQFSGWNTNSAGTGVSYSAGTSYTVNGSSMLYAVWVLNSYKVTFNSNGATGGSVPDPMLAGFNSSITLPGAGTMQKSGYVFGGWNTASSGTGTNYSAGSSYTVLSDSTLFAKWDIAYTISYDANNGDGTVPAPFTGRTGISINLPGGETLSRTGYTFGGWNTNAQGTGATYPVNYAWDLNETIILYAKWNIITYTVSFSGNIPTSGTIPDPMQAAYGSNITLPDEGNLVKTGYLFGGWNTKTDGTGTDYTAGAAYQVTASTTLFAKWVTAYTVTFYGNSNTGGTAPDPVSVLPGTVITLPDAGTLVKTGYSFGGWNTSSGGAGTNYNAGSSYTVNSSIPLYAKWSTKTVSVGAQSGTMTAGVAGSVTFPVTTANIASGSYSVSLTNPPNGVSVSGQVVINNNSGVLTLAGNNSTVAGQYNTLSITIDNASSPAFSLTIKKVVVGAQNGTMTATVAGNVTFPVTTTCIADGNYTATLQNPPAGVTVSGQVNISNNNGTLTLAGNTSSTAAGTYSTLMITIDNVQSSAFALTIGLPPLSGTVTISGNAYTGSTLTAVTTALGGSGTITYLWKRGTTVIGSNSSTYVVLATDEGGTITVTATRANNSGSVTSAATTAVIKPPLTGTVSISGNAYVGSTLTAVTTSLGGSGTIAYTWKRGTTTVGSNGTSYIILSTDQGSSITVTVSRADNSGNVASAATAAVILPPLTGTASISGTPELGQTLTASTSNLSGSGTISYQWKLGSATGTNIGSGSSTYALASTDKGNKIAVVITRVGSSGSISGITSTAVTDPWYWGTWVSSGYVKIIFADDFTTTGRLRLQKWNSIGGYWDSNDDMQANYSVNYSTSQINLTGCLYLNPQNGQMNSASDATLGFAGNGNTFTITTSTLATNVVSALGGSDPIGKVFTKQ